MGGEQISGSEDEELKGEFPLWNPPKTNVAILCLLTLLINQIKLFLDIVLRLL